METLELFLYVSFGVRLFSSSEPRLIPSICVRCFLLNCWVALFLSPRRERKNERLFGGLRALVLVELRWSDLLDWASLEFTTTNHVLYFFLYFPFPFFNFLRNFPFAFFSFYFAYSLLFDECNDKLALLKTIFAFLVIYEVLLLLTMFLAVLHIMWKTILAMQFKLFKSANFYVIS